MMQGMNIKRPNGALRKAEKKAMLIKLTKYIGRVIGYKKEFDGWQMNEISAATGIIPPRLTEIKDYETYKIPISEKNLVLAIGGGLVKIDELMEKAELTEAEKQYLENLILHEMPEEREKLARLYKAGVDIKKELDLLIKKYGA